MGAVLFRAGDFRLVGAAGAARVVNMPSDRPELWPFRDQAIDWIVRLKSGEATEADIEALRRWRDEDPFHEAAFRDAARLWRGVRAAARELAEEEMAAAPQPRSLFAAATQLIRSAFARLRSGERRARPARRAGR